MENIQFNAIEVFKMAQQIEKKGKKFYGIQAERFKNNKDLYDLFLRLKSEEDDHLKTFKNLSEEYKKDINEDGYKHLNDPQVSGYLRALVEFSIFPENIEKDDKNIESINDILLIAIMAEKESILYYQEILKYNEGKTEEVLEKLIEEEKKHLLDLTKISEEYSK